MLVVMLDGKFLHEVFYTFTYESTKMYYDGHLAWDPKYPGKSDQAAMIKLDGLVKWDPVQRAKDKKRMFDTRSTD